MATREIRLWRDSEPDFSAITDYNSISTICKDTSVPINCVKWTLVGALHQK